MRKKEIDPGHDNSEPRRQYPEVLRGKHDTTDLNEARHAIEENPDEITVIDRNGNTKSIKTELIDNTNLKELL